VPLDFCMDLRQIILQHASRRGPLQYQSRRGKISAFFAHEVIPPELAELVAGPLPTDGDLVGRPLCAASRIGPLEIIQFKSMQAFG